MVIPAQQMDNGIDVVTNTLLGNSVVTIPTKSPDILAKALYALVSSRDKREEMSKLIRTKKKDFLWSWDERVAVEMKLLTDLVRGDK
jgi:transaldolase